MNFTKQHPEDNFVMSDCGRFRIGGFKLEGDEPEYVYHAHALPDGDDVLIGIGSLEECKGWCASLLTLARATHGNT